MQGPFSRSDILSWLAESYFDDKLRIRPENGPDASFRELSVMLKAWGHAKGASKVAEPVRPSLHCTCVSCPGCRECCSAAEGPIVWKKDPLIHLV